MTGRGDAQSLKVLDAQLVNALQDHKAVNFGDILATGRKKSFAFLSVKNN